MAELAITFNQILDSLEKSFDAQKQFVSNISHELRTPLATIITELELSGVRDRTTEEYKTIIALTLIAEKTNGIYVNLLSTDHVVNTLMQQLSQIEKKTFTDKSLLNYKTCYSWFLGTMLLFLIVEFLLPERKMRFKS